MNKQQIKAQWVGPAGLTLNSEYIALPEAMHSKCRVIHQMVAEFCKTTVVLSKTNLQK
jgi:hypothetical protein